MSNWILDMLGLGEGSFIHDVLLTHQSDEEYYASVDEMLNPEENNDIDYYNDLYMYAAMDSPADYILEDGTRGWRWTDYDGKVQIHWEEGYNDLNILAGIYEFSIKNRKSE